MADYLIRRSVAACSALLATLLLLAPLSAHAQERIPRYSFELHCAEPLLGSPAEQPGHEVYRMLASLSDWSAANPHSGLLDASLTRIWQEGIGEKSFSRAFCLLVVEDPALLEPARAWLGSLQGIQPDSIVLEQADPADPFAESPPVEFIINGSSYRYPADFSPLERIWANSFARTNYPNQALFIVHPDPRATARFGLGELSRADTFGDGQPIIINTLQEHFDLGELAIPPGMEFYPQFLPTHLVPESDEELRQYLLGQLRQELRSFEGEQMYGSDFWLQLDYPLPQGQEDLASRAGAVFMDWLAAYPAFADGERFGDCSMETRQDDSGRPLQLTLRLNHIATADRLELQEKLAALGLRPSMEFGNSSRSSAASGTLEQSAQYGYLLRNPDEGSVDSALLQQRVNDYLDWRGRVLPPLADAEISVDEKAQPDGSTVSRLKAQLPGSSELVHMLDRVARSLPQQVRWQLDYDVWNREEAVAGIVDINGTRYHYPADFTGVDARNLESQLRYSPGQRVLAIFGGISYQPLEDPALAGKFAYGDLALLERTDEGLTVTTLEQHWEHGVDIAALNIPGGFAPRLQLNLPLWYGNDPQELRGFAREALAAYKVQMYVPPQERQVVSYRQIIANPIPSTELPLSSLAEASARMTPEEKQATLELTRRTYETLLGWIEDTEGFSSGDIRLSPSFVSEGERVTFNANEYEGFVQQIQIGVQDATDEQLVDLMNRIYLATGMRDVWAMGNLFPSLLLDDPEKVNGAATGIVVSTYASER